MCEIGGSTTRLVDADYVSDGWVYNQSNSCWLCVRWVGLQLIEFVLVMCEMGGSTTNLIRVDYV